jgi:hypothetical protein
MHEESEPAAYVLSFTSADSYHSATTYPVKKIFLNRESTEKYAGTQPGYGLGRDWEIERWGIS